MHREKQLERLVFFSDAVIAIALTVLALELKVPHHIPNNDLSGWLVEMIPKFISFALSFVLIAVQWALHRRTFEEVIDFDNWVIAFNFLFLMFVCFLPFPTAVFGEHPSLASGRLYLMANAALGFSFLILWIYVRRHPKMRKGELHEKFSQKLVQIAIPPISMSLAAVFVTNVPIISLCLLAVMAPLQGLVSVLARKMRR